MRLTDTHVHLYVEQFDDDRETVMARARAVGIDHFVLPAIDSSYTERMLALQQRYPGQISLMCGLHPTHVQDNYEAELAHVESELDRHHYVAVGEIGIDLYWDKSRLEAQKDAFARQIAMARKRQLPIVIHCREAFDEVFEVLEAEQYPGLKGIFHCFTGNLEQARRAVGLGMFLGIGGVVTFKNGKIDQFIAQIPLEHIVLETDAPYLAPTPHRGKRNEPSYLKLVLEKLSELYQLPEEEVAKRTSENAQTIFGVQPE